MVEYVFPLVARTLRTTESKAPFGIVSGRIKGNKYSGCFWENCVTGKCKQKEV